jgi:hypothetical protein
MPTSIIPTKAVVVVRRRARADRGRHTVQTTQAPQQLSAYRFFVPVAINSQIDRLIAHAARGSLPRTVPYFFVFPGGDFEPGFS